MPLLRILNKDEVKRKLQDVYEASQASHESADQWDRLLKSNANTFARPSLFDELVVSRLSRPPIITADDLADAFIHHVLRRRESDFDNNYKDFQIAVAAGVNYEQCSQPIECLRYECSSFFDLREIEDPVLWEAEGDFVLTFNGVLLSHRPFDIEVEDDELPHVAYATLVGCCTPRALEAAISETSAVLSSLLRSFYLLADLRRDEFIRDLSRIFDDNVRVVEDVDADQIPDEPLGGLTFLPTLRSLLNTYFSKDIGKTSFTPRLRSAVDLLIQADFQRKHAVGLALSITAIEAMLCDNREGGITKMFSENAAHLLEPELKYRSKAIAFASDLYGKRSKVLHGSETQLAQADFHGARVLAAAVLQALMERCTYVSRLAGSPTEKPSDLFKKLEAHRYTEEPFQGVTLSPAVSLWRGHHVIN